MKRRGLFLIFVLFFFQSSTLFSQHVSFNAVRYRGDKSIGTFLGITQDRLGYIWLASSKSGFYRYDGTEFINYSHIDSNSNSVASNWVECILSDSSGMLWLGTFGKGLDRFDQVTGAFTHYRHDPKNATSLGNDTITAMLEDRSGNLWVGGFNGVDMFDRKSGIFIHYVHDKNDPSSLSSNSIRKIYEDHQGTIWIGCGSPFPESNYDPTDGGLNKFNRTTGKFTRYLHDPKDSNSLETNKVRALFEDSKGNFWVGTSGNGLHIMNREKGNFTHYYYDSTHPEKLSRPPDSKIDFDHITFINEDVAGNIWIGSLTAGINRYDPVSKKISHFGIVALGQKNVSHIQDTASGYFDLTSWDGLFSQDGLIWITTFQTFTGNYLYSANLFKKTVPFFPIGKPGANTFYAESDSVLWIGTDQGLIKKNRRLGTEKYYVHDPTNTNSLSSSNIAAIRMDKDKNIWIGGLAPGGLNKFNPHTNTVTRFMHDDKNSASLSNDLIWSMAMDHNDDLWIGTAKGLNKMNGQNGSFRRYLSNDMVLCLREDHNNEMWVASDNGLNRINITSGAITSVLKNALIKSLCIDSKDDIWIGGDTGRTGDQSLYRFDKSRNRFALFLDPNVKSQINGVFDILEDDKKNIWVSTTTAILKINEGRTSLRRYGESYGVHQNNFGTGDNYQTPDGKLFFGDSKGYYSFSPDDLKENSKPILNFTSFKLNDREVNPAEGTILSAPIWETDEFRLPHNQNSFSLEFVGINYQAIGDVKYSFILENYESAAHKYGTEHRAYYFNVPPGHYTFKVRALSPDGGWNDRSMRIIIDPPWWQTWWAYTIFAALFIACLWGFTYYRSQKLRTENRQLEEKVANRTNQLNQSIDELKATQAQLIQSEKMASLGELTAGIAHEIQNPLNFVNNFSEVNAELIAEMREEIAKGNLNEVSTLANDIEENERKIIHHGKRADAIVKGMLQHSRSSGGQKEAVDLNALADEYLRLSYHGLRAKDKSMNATMNTNFDPAMGKVNLVPQDIGRVLLNLYNNAFYSVTDKKKQRPQGFDPMISVSTQRMGNSAEIKISDNGLGVPKQILDKIFQPFFTTKPTGSGTGLGLSLSYDIIKAHGGQLKVESLEGEGATFIIIIPV